MRVAVIGVGRMGKIRAQIVKDDPLSQLVAICDSNLNFMVGDFINQDCALYFDWESVVARKDIDAVVVSTPTNTHCKIATAALKAGKHVLCEKPFGLNVEEAKLMCNVAERAKRSLQIGFNYRYLPHVMAAKKIISDGGIGDLNFFRSKFGHGGRLNYEKEWCTKKEFGGGVLMEQGIHMVDLIQHLFGIPLSVQAKTDLCYHNFSDSEDNAFCLFETTSGLAQTHVSWTQWKSIFEVEIFGSAGYLRLKGRDGHYGHPKLIWGKRQQDHSRPSETVFEFSKAENFWTLEWRDFRNVQMNLAQIGNRRFGLKAQQIIEAAYKSSVTKCWENT